MKALITGISGFAGFHLNAWLSKQGREVFGIDRNPFENTIVADILDSKALFHAIKKIKPDEIYHLAGFSSVSKSYDEPELCFKINVDGTKNLLDAVINANIHPKILVVSSAEVYGIPGRIPIREIDALNPISPYGKSKLEQEGLCHRYIEKNSLDIVISRSFPHIGPGQLPIFAVSEFSKRIAEIEKGLYEPVIHVGNLLIKRDFTDVRDIAKAYCSALASGKTGETYNICSGKAHTIGYMLKTLLTFSKNSISIEKDPNKVRKNDIPILQGDFSKFDKATKWKPEIPMKKSLSDTLDYWRKNI